MQEKEIIENLMSKIIALRSAQRDYFARKWEIDKKLAIVLESSLDEYVKQLKRLGYDPENVKPNPRQNKMF